MPKHIKFLMFHAVAGFAFAAFLVLTLLVFDVASLRYLMLKSDMKWIAFITLMASMGITFSSVQMGIAIMRLGHKDDTKIRRSRPQNSIDRPTFANPLVERRTRTREIRLTALERPASPSCVVRW